MIYLKGRIYARVVIKFYLTNMKITNEISIVQKKKGYDKH